MSIQQQQGVRFEFVLVNDGSNDGSAELLIRLPHLTHDYAVHRPHRGLTAC